MKRFFKTTLVVLGLITGLAMFTGCDVTEDLLGAFAEFSLYGTVDVEYDASLDDLEEEFSIDAGDIDFGIYRKGDNEAAFLNCEASGSASTSSDDDDDDDDVEERLSALATDDDDDDDDSDASGSASIDAEAEGEGSWSCELKASELSEGVEDVEVVTDEDDMGESAAEAGADFELQELPGSLLFILTADVKSSALEDGVSCTSDIMGFDEETKLITSESAIGPNLFDGLSDVFEGALDLDLLRSVAINCAYSMPPSASDVTVPPAPEPSTDPGDDEGDLPQPTSSTWTAFTVTGKGGDPAIADAGTASVIVNDFCGADMPAVVEIIGECADCGDEATLWIQEGKGENAVIGSQIVPNDGGTYTTLMTLSGGYARLQLDADGDITTTDDVTFIAELCEGEMPAQELLVVTSWNIDNTDVDTHVYADGMHIWYADKDPAIGNLDIDDTNGFGPETITSEMTGLEWEVKLHYYSDHGQGNTNASVRVIYFDGVDVCDLTIPVDDFASGEWFPVGIFGGADFVCPDLSAIE
jgi:hypothetical protein